MSDLHHEVLALGGELRHCFPEQRTLAAPGSSGHLRSRWLSQLPRTPCCLPCRLPYPWPASASSASAGPAVQHRCCNNNEHTISLCGVCTSW